MLADRRPPQLYLCKSNYKHAEFTLTQVEFRILFNVKQADDLEVNEFGEIRTNMFYCDPMASWQKPHIEKAHEYLRYVLPKGTTFKNLTQDDVTLLMNHINSVKRPSLKGKSPYEKVRKKDKDLHLLMEKLKMHLIPADEVHLTRDLLR